MGLPRTLGAFFDRRAHVGALRRVHCVVDDHSRLAYVELHPHEDADTNAATRARALAFFADLGLDPPEAVMTDNAFVYTKSARFGSLLTGCGARHIVTPPYTPRWNGKVEASSTPCRYILVSTSSLVRPFKEPRSICLKRCGNSSASFR
jgi:hypothetical protein